MLADQNGGGAGGIYIYNNGTDAPTTITSTALLGVPTSADGIYIGTDGPLTIAGTILNLGSWVDIHNNGTGAGNFTDISGNVGSVDTIHVYNSLSPANKPLTISGVLLANNNIDIDNVGASAGNMTTISGSVTSLAGNVYVYHLGLPTGKLTVSGSLNAAVDVSMFSGRHAQISTVKTRATTSSRR